MCAVIPLSLVLLAFANPSQLSPPPYNEGVGVLGDSYSDEYRFYPPDRPTAQNWVEILATRGLLNFGEYTTDKRPEPRNQGFAFNWARSDATTEDAIKGGQLDGLVAQVKRGKVKLAIVFIGGNDFINAMKSDDPMNAIEKALPRATANFRKIVRSLLEASPDLKLVLATIPDIRNLPEFAVPLREGRLSSEIADAYTVAIRKYNFLITTQGLTEPRIAVANLAVGTSLANQWSTEAFPVAGKMIDRIHPGNTPEHFFLADQRHTGTYGQALIAQMLVDTIDVKFHLGIKPLAPDEIRRLVQPSLSDTLARGVFP